MTEEKSETSSSRPFQLRPSILSSGFGNPFASAAAAASAEKKGFVLRPSALSSAAEQLETIHKQEARKRPLEDADSTSTEVEDAKKTKTSDEAPTNPDTSTVTDDIKKPTGIGTFGFAANDTSSTNSSDTDNSNQSKANYFQQGLNSTNNSEKITFGFGASVKPTFSSINKNKDDGDDTDENNDTTNETDAAENASKVKLLENAEEYQKSHNQKQQYKEVEQFTGEEGEQLVLQLICKLHLYDKEKKRWLEKGRGTLRLNDICQSEGVFQSRLVFRTQGTNIVLLNTKLWAEMCCEKVKAKSIRITALDSKTNEVKVYLITANLKDSLQTYTAIDRRIEALKRNRVSKDDDTTNSNDSKAHTTDDEEDEDDDDDDDDSSGEVSTRPRSTTLMSSRSGEDNEDSNHS